MRLEWGRPRADRFTAARPPPRLVGVLPNPQTTFAGDPKTLKSTGRPFKWGRWQSLLVRIPSTLWEDGVWATHLEVTLKCPCSTDDRATLDMS